jgi:hypothetical protein
VALASRDSLWFGLACIVLSLGIGAFGYTRATRAFVHTTGVITSTQIGSPGGRTATASQRVLYQYTVDGTEYTGQTLAPVRGISGAAIRVGATIPVYFERAWPYSSSAFSPPRPWLWIGGAATFTAFGLVVIIVGWTQ